MEEGTYVTISVVYTGMSANKTYTLQDATGGIAIYGPDSEITSALATGKAVKITGVTTSYHGLVQLGSAVYVGMDWSNSIDTTPTDISAFAAWDADTLLAYQSMPVSITGATVSNLEIDETYGNVEMTLTLGELSINFKWDSRVSVDGVSPLDYVENGDTVDIVGAPVNWYDGAALGFSDVSQVVINPLDDTRAAEMDKEALTFRTAVTASQDIDLTVAGANGTTITWASDNAAIVITDGVASVTVGDTTESAKLTATIVKGDASITKEFTVTVGMPEPDLFISEYIEGTPGNRKAIEIYNPTDADIVLDDVYSLFKNVNAYDYWDLVIDLTGTIGAGETLVIYYDDSTNNDMLGTYGDVETSDLNFNGDDAIGLFKNDALIDIFGVFGEDPGSSWAVGDGNTKDYVITRNADVDRPSEIWDATQWTAVAAYVDGSVTTLGSHTVDAE
ncbi:lamin tail domain-containing protein [Mycoplasmatota bacterium]|nr:lamin tail domain-containing protein [Mycoplasmatota bacterium]